MSSPRDVDPRTTRRFGRDLAEKEQRRRSDPTAARSARRGAERRRDSPEDWSQLADEELERIPPRGKLGRKSSTSSARADGSRSVQARPAEPVAGFVVATSRGPCEVELDDGREVLAHLPKAMARADRSRLAVGDRVELAHRPSGDLAVARRLPRTSRLARPDPAARHRERVLVANLELGVVVASLRRPALTTGLIDRFLVALEHGDVSAAIAVNKADLAGDDEELARASDLLAPYRGLGLPVTFCSSKTGEGLAELRRWIAGRLAAFVGHSGVGKSSLLNALLPGAGAVIGEVSTQRGRGRHTTSRARVYRLPGGGRLVDTPGVREFGLERLTPRELALYFDEFAPFAEDCRFNDCTHLHEPSCAVREAVEGAAIPAARFAAYRRILASFEAD